ncbi:uncharacterized protein [Littorina saxatilis]|uniref:uncharacterized protein n=1 Tax=Littorina saxatilis TaxID=31220 RepID=UPI0038B65E75
MAFLQVGKNTVRALTFFLPLGVSLVLNLALVIALRTHFANRRAIRTSNGKNGQGNPEGQTSKPSNTKAETQTTKLILAFSFTFVLLALPRAVNHTLTTYVDGYGIFQQEHYLYQTVTKLTQLLTHATEVTLFFVCLVYSRRFRQALQRMACVGMCRKLLRKSSGPSKTTGETATDGSTGNFDNITETQNDTVDDSV